MATLASEDNETGDLTGYDAFSPNNVDHVGVTTASALDGTYGLEMSPGASGSRRVVLDFTPPASDITHVAFRVNLRSIEQIVDHGDSSYTILARDQGERFVLRLYTSGIASEDLVHEVRLVLIDGTVTLSSGNIELPRTDGETRIEMEVYRHATLGYIKLWCDGMLKYTSPNSQTNANNAPNSIQMGIRTTGSILWVGNRDVYFDDLTITDTSALVFDNVGTGDKLLGLATISIDGRVDSSQCNATKSMSFAVATAVTAQSHATRDGPGLFRCHNEGITVPTPDSGGGGVEKDLQTTAVGVDATMAATYDRIVGAAPSPLTAPDPPWLEGYPTSKWPVQTTPPDYTDVLGPWMMWDESDLTTWKDEIDGSPSGFLAELKADFHSVRTEYASSSAHEEGLTMWALMFGLEDDGTFKDTLGTEIYITLDVMAGELDWEGNSGQGGSIDRNSGRRCLQYTVALNAIEAWLVTDDHAGDGGRKSVKDLKNRVVRELIRTVSALDNGTVWFEGETGGISSGAKLSSWVRSYHANHCVSSIVGMLFAAAFLKNVTDDADIDYKWIDAEHGAPSGSGTDNEILVSDLTGSDGWIQRALEEFQRIHYTYGQRSDGAGYEGTGYSTNMMNGGTAWAYPLLQRIWGHDGIGASRAMYMYPVYQAYCQAQSGWSRREVPTHGDIATNWYQLAGGSGCFRMLAKYWGGQTDGEPVAQAAQWLADNLVASTDAKFQSGTNGVWNGRQLKLVVGWSYSMSGVLEFINYDTSVVATRPDLQTKPWPRYFHADDLDILISRSGWGGTTGYQMGVKAGTYGKHKRSIAEASGFTWYVDENGMKTRGQWNNDQSNPTHDKAVDQTDKDAGDADFPPDTVLNPAHAHCAGPFVIFGASEDSYMRPEIPGKQPTVHPWGRRMDSKGCVGIGRSASPEGPDASGYEGGMGQQGMRGHKNGIHASQRPIDQYNPNNDSTSGNENLGPKNFQHDREDFDLLGSVGHDLWAGADQMTFSDINLTDAYTSRSKDGTGSIADTRSVDWNLSEARRFLFFSPDTGYTFYIDIMHSSDPQTYYNGIVGYPTAGIADSSWLKVPCGGSNLFAYNVLRPAPAAFEGIDWDLNAYQIGSGQKQELTAKWVGDDSRDFTCNRVVKTTLANEMLRFVIFAGPTTTGGYAAWKPATSLMHDDATKTAVRVGYQSNEEEVYIVGHHESAGQWSVTHDGETYTVDGKAAFVRKATAGGTIERLFLAGGKFLKEGTTTYISTTNTHQCISIKQAGNTLDIDAYKSWADRAIVAPEQFTVDTGNGSVDEVNVNGVTTTFVTGGGTSWIIG